MQMVYHISKRTSLIRFWGGIVSIDYKMIYSSHSQLSEDEVRITASFFDRMPEENAARL
jgi:hypothetical protein